MRAVHVAPARIGDPSAGTTYAVTRLCRSLAQRGMQVELHGLNPLPSDGDPTYPSIGYPSWRIPTRAGVSPALHRGLNHAVSAMDILHTHGVWYMPSVYAGMVARRLGCPFIYSVHGMLAPQALQRSRWAKAVFDRLGQRASLEAAGCIHATAGSEMADVRRFGLKQPVAVVPYGVDIPAQVEALAFERRTALFLGRVDPIKRVEVLVRAWREVEGVFPDWDLVVCGPDSVGHLPEMRALAAALGLSRVSFVGPKYGEEKARLLGTSELLVLPSHSENFGFVVAEALSAGLPAIVTRGAPWQGLETHHCGWWIDISVESLALCLRTALATDVPELRAMGARGREWMIRDLSWSRVAEMMELTYLWMLGRADRPAWVHLD